MRCPHGRGYSKSQIIHRGLKLMRRPPRVIIRRLSKLSGRRRPASGEAQLAVGKTIACPR
jgi:hypothetical protein